MTMAAVAALALTRATSSGVRSAELGGAGSSPCGPLLKILPSALANAASAAWDTPVASRCVVELGKLQPARLSTSATGTTAALALGGGVLEQPVQVRLADLGGLPGVAVVVVELDDQPAVVAGLPYGPHDFREVEHALSQRQPAERIRAEVLQVDVADAVGVPADELRGVTATRGQMRRVRTESDAGTWQQPCQLVRALHDRGEMRVVAGGQAMLLGDVGDPVEGAGEPLVVGVLGTGRAPGAAADH